MSGVSRTGVASLKKVVMPCCCHSRITANTRAALVSSKKKAQTGNVFTGVVDTGEKIEQIFEIDLIIKHPCQLLVRLRTAKNWTFLVGCSQARSCRVAERNPTIDKGKCWVTRSAPPNLQSTDYLLPTEMRSPNSWLYPSSPCSLISIPCNSASSLTRKPTVASIILRIIKVPTPEIT